MTSPPMVERSGFAWLASYPKSGNTWFRTFLAGISRQEGLDINRLGDPIASSREWLDEALPFSTADLTPDEIDAIRPHAYAHHHSRIGGVVKVHDAFTQLGDGALLPAGALVRSALYIVRSPLDVAPSFAHHFGLSIDQALDRMESEDTVLSHDITRLRAQTPQRLLSWSSHVKGWIEAPSLKVHVLRFEDMLADPINAFGRALGFLGMAYDDKAFARALELSRFERLRDQEEAHGFDERLAAARPFFRLGAAGGWREALNPAQIARVVAAHGDMMRRLGYLDALGRPV